ncbi:hypothetical protein [Micromonospora sp. NPDC049891]|uniref:hypothetical protein n=1 Tax=Micromonospora sp. NPDC049891 TaxID=3155655 RepID=UPI0033C00373
MLEEQSYIWSLAPEMQSYILDLMSADALKSLAQSSGKASEELVGGYLRSKKIGDVNTRSLVDKDALSTDKLVDGLAHGDYWRIGDPQEYLEALRKTVPNLSSEPSGSGSMQAQFISSCTSSDPSKEDAINRRTAFRQFVQECLANDRLVSTSPGKPVNLGGLELSVVTYLWATGQIGLR